MNTNTATNHYGSLAAEIYDLDKPVGSMPDTPFYLRRLAGLRGPVLEPACGSGRTLAALLNAGLDATGFDPSAEMLERCRARCAEKGFSPSLSRQHFDDFHYDQKFAAIVIPAASFTLIDTFDQAIGVLRRFGEHLASGGLLMLDIEPLRSLGATGQDQRRWTADNGDLLTLEQASVKTEWLAQRREAMGRYERWRDGALVESQLMPWAQRFWGLEEFRLALQSVGFGAISVTGGYDSGRPARESDRIWTFEATLAGPFQANPDAFTSRTPILA